MVLTNDVFGLLRRMEMDHRETFNACGLIETPDSVSIIHGMAGDNAATMVADIRDENGTHSDEFIDAWMLSVSGVLAYANDYLTKDESVEAREWFAARGIDY